jgi:hypothetical protein
MAPRNVAPCLVLTGTESEAHSVLQLLGCVVRHALPLTEISMATFRSISLQIQPTMLIGYVRPSMRRLLSASSHRTYVPTKSGLIDPSCPKTAYAGTTSWGIAGDCMLTIDCTLNCRKLPIIRDARLESIASEFQPKLLDYRFKHARYVQVGDYYFCEARSCTTKILMLWKRFAGQKLVRVCCHVYK